jgi:hypothetical protein
VYFKVPKDQISHILTATRQISGEDFVSVILYPRREIGSVMSFNNLSIHKTNLLKCRINVILLFPSRSSKLAFAEDSHHNSVYIHSSPPILSTCPAYCSVLHFTILTILRDLYKSRSSSLCSIIKCLFTSFFLCPCIFFNILSPNNCNLCSSLKAGDYVSYLHKTIWFFSCNFVYPDHQRFVWSRRDCNNFRTE